MKIPDKYILHEGTHWSLYLRPVQITAFAAIVVNKDNKQYLYDCENESRYEYIEILASYENFVINFLKGELLNTYTLMLMDKGYHTHLFPRYRKSVCYKNIRLFDDFFPDRISFSYQKILDDMDISSMKAIYLNYLEAQI